MTTPTKRQIQDNKSTVSVKLPNLSAAKPPKLFNTFTKLNGRMQLIPTIDLGMKISTKSRKFKKNSNHSNFRQKIEIEANILTPRTKFLNAKSVQRQPGSLTSINLKKTGILSTKDRKQEHQEHKRRSQEEIQDGEGRSSITPGSSPNQERRKQEAAAAAASSSSSIPRQKSSTKNLVNFFDKKL